MNSSADKDGTTCSGLRGNNSVLQCLNESRQSWQPCSSSSVSPRCFCANSSARSRT